MDYTIKRLIEKFQQDGVKSLYKPIKTYMDNLISPKLLMSNIYLSNRTINRKRLEQIAINTHCYSEGEEICVNQWKSIDELPTILENQIGEYYIPQPFISVIDGINIIGKTGICTQNGRVILEAHRADKPALSKDIQFAEDLRTLRKLPNEPPDEHFDLICPLNEWTSKTATGYFSWLCHWLPLLEGLQQYSNITGHNPLLLLPNNPSDFILESLELIGYSKDDWIEWEYNNIEVDNLVIPSFRKPENTRSYQSHLLSNHILNKRYEGKIVSKNGANWLRDKYIEELSSNSTSVNTNRIFISRENARSRSIVNKDEIMNILYNYGFESYKLEEYNFKDQVTLFLNADAVLGVHGAGLANTIFSRECKIIEIYGELIKPTYFMISNIVDNNYGFILGKQKNKNVYIHPDKLERQLELMNL